MKKLSFAKNVMLVKKNSLSNKLSNNKIIKFQIFDKQSSTDLGDLTIERVLH